MVRMGRSRLSCGTGCLVNSLTATEPLHVQWSRLAEHAKANAEEFVEISYTLADQLRSRDAQEALRVVLRAYEVVPLIHEKVARLRASLKCYRLLADVYFRLGNLNRCQQYLLSAFEVLEAAPTHIEPIFFQYIYNIQEYGIRPEIKSFNEFTNWRLKCPQVSS